MTQFEKRRRDRISRAGPQKGNRSERCGRTSSSTGLQRGLRRCELTGMADFGFTFQTRCGCSCGQLPKPNRETTRFSHSKRETRKPPITIFAPILTTPHVVCYSHCISSDSAQFFCVFSGGLQAHQPPTRFWQQQHQQENETPKEWRADEEARRRDKVEPKVVQRWHLWTSFSSAGARKRRWRRASAPGAREKATETKENHGSEMAGQNGGVRGGRVKVSSQAVVSRAGLTLR